MLIQQGASLAYVKEQMGHSSIQVTVDTYGHLIPGGNIEWVDALDAKTSPQPPRNHAVAAVEANRGKLLKRLVGLGRFELPTHGLGNRGPVNSGIEYHFWNLHITDAAA